MYTHSRLVAEREVAFTLFTSVGYTWTTGLATQRRDGDNLDIDPKVPVLTSESLKDFKTYQRAVQATWLSLSEEEQKRLGPKLYRNLLGAKTSVSIFIEQLDPALLTGTDGPAKLLAELENGRFQRTGFQEMPRAYETFYEKTVFQRGGLEPMAMYLTAIEVAKRDLEAVDPKTKISQNELGYHALKNSGLSREEQRMVLSRADETYDFAKISQTLKNLFPRGTHTGRQTEQHQTRHRQRRAPPRFRQGSRWAQLAAEEYDYDDEEQTYEDAMWVQDDQGYWYEWSDEQHSYVCYDDFPETHDESNAFFLEDAVDEWMAEEDPSYNESLVTMRQSRDTMNRLRSARGFLKGKIDGVLEESSGPSMQTGKGKGKTKGKGKGRGRPVVRCKNCGRTDHDSADCPQMQVDGGSSSSSIAPRSLWTPRSNGKGKGGGRKGKRQFGM